ncbi:AAA family ATPase [Rhizophagus clarus]|uniref:AAA family ATPase n=1 Tax=Rhizophagus clarus TaxID=94130 RepID=A0A8H3KSH3_9GLOM|nr:AAA family ATPase [Rhizophagus clarus]
MNAGVAEHQRCEACNQTIKQNMKAYKITHVPDQQADKQEWLGKENPERYEDGSIWWFSRRIPKLAPKKVKNEDGFEYWHLAREAYKPHITNNYAKRIRDLMDDDEEYVIGVASDWRTGRMVEQIQLDKSGAFLGIKEVWVPEGKEEYHMDLHGWPSLCAHFYGKASLDELLLIDKGGWLSWKDSDAIKLNEYQDEPNDLELEGQPYILRFQFMACPRQKLYGPGIHEDGTVWWHSDGLVRVSYKMASEVCHLLYNSTEYTLFTRLYTSEGIVEEMGDKGWHFGKKKKARSLIGEEITPGQLKGIDKFLVLKTREYVKHICYELRPVLRPQGPPGPFYDGDLNWLTPARESALAKFNEKVRAPGCTLDDLHDLEKPEKSGGIGMKIVIKDILGNEMWDSGRYLKQHKLTVFCHNNHAWTGGIPEMPRVSSVYDMDYECERALVSACTKTKKGEVNIDEKKIAEALISFVARNLPRATRIWIVGKEILTHEGILYHSSHEWKKLNDTFICEKSQSIPEELLWEENVDIRQWIEDKYQSNTLSPSEELKAENVVEIWHKSQVESMVWNAPIDPPPKHIHIDLRGAYLGCEDSERSASEALPWVRRYGFPERIQQRAQVDNIDTIRNLTGIVQLIAWEFAQNLHPFTAGLIGQHLAEKEGWIPTPLVDYLLSKGWLSSATPREVIYSVGKKSRIEFPPDRDLAVRFVGSCARNAQVTSILVRDINEADMLVNWLAKNKRRPNWTRTEQGTLIKYEGDEKRGQWLHIRSFVLAYTHIAVLEQLKRFPIKNVLRVCTDAIYTTAIPETILDETVVEMGQKLLPNFDESLFAKAKNSAELEEVHAKYEAELDKKRKQYELAIILETPEIKYGQWRKKKEGYTYRKEVSFWAINYKGTLEIPPSDAPPLSIDSKLITLQKGYLVGQGGSGKTTQAICAFPGRKVVVLTPANLLAEYHRKQNPGLTAMTYHKYFHLGATPIDEWDPACLGKKALAEILIVDEACMIPKKVLQRLLSYAESRGCQSIMCEDPGQLTPWGDKEGPHKFLTEWANEVIWCMDDYRAYDPELKALIKMIVLNPNVLRF